MFDFAFRIRRCCVASFALVTACVGLAGSGQCAVDMNLVSSFGGDYNAVDNDGDIACVAEGARLRVYDTSIPTSPALLGQILLPGRIDDVAVSGTLVAAGGENAAHLVSISDPALPALLGSYPMPVTAHGVAFKDNQLYVAAESAGLKILNITDPTSPTLTAEYAASGSVADVTLSGTLAFLACRNSGMEIANVSDPSLRNSSAHSVRLALRCPLL